MTMTFETGESARRVLSAGFWRAQVVGWLILLVLGFCIRLVVFGNIEASLWLTLVIKPLAFALTSAAAIWHVRHAPRGIPLPIVLPCVVMLCAAAAALLAARNERISKMKAETRAVQIELEHLQTQIEPHFLFNALNTLVAEIPERPHIAEEMTRRLADYLRYSLGNRGDGMCRMSEELAAAEYYIRIQELRFDKRLAYQSQVDPSTLSALIPHMTLQGLIENAIKHGHWNDDEPFLINLRVARLHESLIIEVGNPGQLHTSQVRDRYGLGLSNLCRCLDLHYPGRNEFSLIQTAGRTVARLTLHGEPASL